MLCLLTACKADVTENKNADTFFIKPAEERTAMLSEPVTDYEVPKTYPSVMVDLYGYGIGEKKEAMLVAQRLPASFVIKDADSDEIKYKGNVSIRECDAKDGLLTGIADFSDFDEEGIFYIETEILGKSKGFTITENVYESLLEETYRKLHGLRCEGCHETNLSFEANASERMVIQGGWHTQTNGEKDVVEACMAVMDICTAFEYFPKSFSDEYGSLDSGNHIPDVLDETAYEVNWLLKMQNKETGGVYTSVSYGSESTKFEDKLVIRGETTRATAYFCASMAKFSSVIKKYDRNLSDEAFQAAGLAWACLEANRDIVAEDQMYRAAAEMYRASGQDVFKKAVTDYIEKNVDKPYEGTLGLDASLTYLATPRATNVEYCTKLMSNFMSRTEEKVAISKASRYGIENDTADEQALLRNAFELAIVDYINTSNEFVPLEKEYLHFFFGRNQYSMNYYNDICSPDQLAKLIAIVSRLEQGRED